MTTNQTTKLRALISTELEYITLHTECLLGETDDDSVLLELAQDTLKLIEYDFTYCLYDTLYKDFLIVIDDIELCDTHHQLTHKREILSHCYTLQQYFEILLDVE